MKEYLTLGAVGVGLVAVAAIVGLNSGNTTRDKTANGDDAVAGCAASRTHIEDALQTTRADGMYHKLVRKSVRTPIRGVLIRMGGKTRARENTLNSRTFAKEKLAEGVTGAEKRYYLDTIMSADALIAILDCLER